MYFIYVDEAGSSQHEPVTVVLGVIIQADKHWRAAERCIQSTYDTHVPSSLRDGFIFHAKDALNGYRDYSSWRREERLSFIGAMAAIPRKLQTAISLGMERRAGMFPSELTGKIYPWEFHRIRAFHGCISRADKYVRDWAKTEEVATVIAEDVPKNRRILKALVDLVLPEPPVSKETVIPTIDEQRAGALFQTPTGRMERIVDTVHFVEKNKGRLLPIADACAFSFRRFFDELPYGADLVRSTIGHDIPLEDWRGHGSNMTYSFNPNHQYPSPGWPVYRL